MLRSEEYAAEFLNILRKDGHRTNMYENVDGYLKDKDRQTIYKHQFFMYGNYSDQYNRFTLAYLLVMEAVLDRRHVWLHLDQNTHYCQIEQYHIYMSCIHKTACFLANYAPHSLQAGRKMEPHGSKRVSFSEWSELLRTKTGLKPWIQASANQRPSCH